MVSCPICQKAVQESNINRHLDANCQRYADDDATSSSAAATTQLPPSTNTNTNTNTKKPPRVAADFFTPGPRRTASGREDDGDLQSSPSTPSAALLGPVKPPASTAPTATSGEKRSRDEREQDGDGEAPASEEKGKVERAVPPTSKKAKHSHAPLAERMRPRSLDEVTGQALVGKDGVLRRLMASERVPSMILWGGPGTGKTTIARLLAQTAGTRFVEIHSTSSGVAECKRLFAEARHELALTGRRTIVFCDEIHRFSKSQQDVFLAPVEAGHITLIGATTENPSFKVVNALLSRCRTFTLAKLTDEDVFGILRRALAREVPELPTPSASPVGQEGEQREPASSPSVTPPSSLHLLSDGDHALMRYLAAFADGDARTGLNLLELAMDLCRRPSMTIDDIKKSLTQTLVYDRAGDQHYDTISAFHKSVRGSDPDAALYYLARMLQSGEDPLYVARRMVVIASEDVGLADNSLLSLATATYTAAEKIGMPECRINLGHCAVALALAPKSVRAYRGLSAAYAALDEPGIAGLPVPIHLRNAPTRLMKELGYGKEYKYNPDFQGGRVAQDYLPPKMEGRKFLGPEDLGSKIDDDLVDSPDDSEVAAEIDADVDAGEVLLGPDGD